MPVASLRRSLLHVSACALAFAAAPASAQCNFPIFQSGGAITVGQGIPLTPTVNQGSHYWSAVAIRSDPGADWDLGAYLFPATAPQCVSGTLATSLRGGSQVDLVVGDFNDAPTPQTFYVGPTLYSGTGTAKLEWECDGLTLGVNLPGVSRTTGPNDVIEVWDLALKAGLSYSFEARVDGPANMKLLLFRNPGAGGYWTSRNGAYREFNLGPYSNTVGEFSVPADDYYGVVLLNENGATSTYELSFQSCVGTPATTMVEFETYPVSEPHGRFLFTPLSPFFMAVGVRPDQPGQSWNVRVGQEAGGPAPDCYQTHLANSFETGRTAYVVGDFNTNPLGVPAHARIWPSLGTGGGSTGSAEWGYTGGQLAVGSGNALGSTGPDDVLASWDVELLAGNRYRVNFAHTGPAKVSLALFGNEGGSYWAPRSYALVEDDSTFFFDCTRTDHYGLVLVNDNGQSGTYHIFVDVPNPVDVEPVAEVPTGLEGVHPNPVRGNGRILYSLARPADVGFDVMDVTGRRVAALRPGRREAGRGSIGWSGADEEGRRLAAGVYFVRMRVDGRPVEDARVVQLP
jgi:hypothetical protein